VDNIRFLHAENDRKGLGNRRMGEWGIFGLFEWKNGEVEDRETGVRFAELQAKG